MEIHAVIKPPANDVITNIYLSEDIKLCLVYFCLCFVRVINNRTMPNMIENILNISTRLKCGGVIINCAHKTPVIAAGAVFISIFFCRLKLPLEKC